MRNLIKKLILFLIRKLLRVDKYELFFFCNQKSSNAVYFFNDDGLMKTWWSKGSGMYDGAVKSSVSLNWILDDRCKIDKYVGE